jgi:hypothetical protein
MCCFVMSLLSFLRPQRNFGNVHMRIAATRDRCLIRRPVALTLLGAWLTVTSAWTQPSLEQAEQTIQRAWENQKALTAKATLTAKIPIGTNRLSLSGEGTLAVLRSGGTEKFRQKMKVVSDANPSPLEASLDVVFDGTTLHLISTAKGATQATTAQPDLRRGVAPPGGKMLLDVLHENLDIRVKAESELDGHAVFVLEGTPKVSVTDLPFGRLIAHVDKETGLLLKMDLYEVGGIEPTATLRYTDVNTKAEVNAEDFALPPAMGDISNQGPAGGTSTPAPSQNAPSDTKAPSP